MIKSQKRKDWQSDGQKPKRGDIGKVMVRNQIRRDWQSDDQKPKKGLIGKVMIRSQKEERLPK